MDSVTVSGLSGILEFGRRTGDTVTRLTAPQLRMWNSWLVSRASLKLCACSVRIRGILDLPALEDSILAVIERHESLRTRIETVNGVPRQIAIPKVRSIVEVVDVSSAKDIEQDALAVARRFVQESVDLSVGPPIECRVLRLSGFEYVLVIAVDHMISDGRSCEIINSEMWATYDHLLRGLPNPLGAVGIQFGDYAFWQQQVRDQWIRIHGSYWASRLRGAARVEIPLDETSSEAMVDRGDVMQFPLDMVSCRMLYELAVKHGSTVSLVVLTTYVVTMSRWCGLDDVLTEFIVNNRRVLPQLRSMIGLLATSLFLRIEIHSADSFVDLVRRVNLEFQTACDHQDFGGWVPDLVAESESALYFNWFPKRARSALRPSGGRDFELRPYPETFAWSVKFLPFFYENHNGIGLIVHFRPDLIPGATIRRFGNSFRKLTQKLVDAPLARIETLW